MAKLLVNADDFGLSPAINAGIIAAHTQGIVTSTSMVAAGVAFDAAVVASRQYPDLGIGVHLTLVEEQALAMPDPLPATYGKLMKGIVTGRIPLRHIELEFRVQIEKCAAAGIAITHLDSHQHTHALPPLFAMTIRLAREYGIRGIRIPRGWPARRHLKSNRFAGKCLLCLLSHADAVLFSRHGCVTPDHIAGVFESGDLTEENVLRILADLGPGTTELECHPGMPETLPQYASWNQKRQIELASLTSARVKQAIQNAGIQLINYRQL